MKKKIVALLLAVAMTSCLAGCAETEATKPSTTEATVEDVSNTDETTENNDTDSAVSEVTENESDIESDLNETENESASEVEDLSSDESETEHEEPKRPEYKAEDYITLGEYKNLKVEVEKAEVTDEEVDDEIKFTLSYTEDAHDHIKEGVVKDGDTVNIDYVGTLDGEEFDGGSDEGYDLEIGSGSFIEGFEEGLIGKKVGETVDLNLTFPEDYTEDLAGKDVVFTVTINYILAQKELDDELAKSLSDGEANTVEEYRNVIKEDLLNQKLETQKSEASSKLIAEAVKNSTFKELPQELIDYLSHQIEDAYAYYAEMFGMSIEDMLVDNDGKPITIEEMATDSAKEMICIEAIANAENLVSDDDLDAKYTEMAEEYGFENKDELFSYYDSSDLKMEVLNNAVMDFLYENAEITETAPTEDTYEEELSEDETTSEEELVLGENEEVVLDEETEDTSTSPDATESTTESTSN